ncbi:MAG: DUF3662 and FHA domain-containing protein [Nocardioidaceae bacterium]
MGLLQRFENRLEQVVSGTFARAFRSAVQPVELAAALQREVDNNAQVVSRDRRLVPNSFDIELASADYDRLAPYAGTLSQELTELLREHADEQHYVFAGDVAIDFHRADDLSTGRFRVKGVATAAVTPTATDDEGGFFARRAASKAAKQVSVMLEVNGAEQLVLPPGLIVGRGPEADLRINDPGVSRKHAEIRVTDHQPPKVGVIDLGSTNGTLVDGHRIERTAVGDGSVVKIGNTELVVRLVTGGADVD